MYNTEYGGWTITISDENGIEYTLEAHPNGGAPNCYLVPYIYYIKPGTYTITSISGSRASNNYNLNRVYVGKTVNIESENMFYLTE